MEATKSNNTGIAAQSTAITYGPDLVVTSVVAPSSATAGTQISIPITVKNQGVTLASSFNVALYLSPDGTISNYDTLITSFAVSSLGAGQETTTNLSFTVPSMASGTYYFGAIADSTNRVSESDETNNSLAASQATVF